MARAHATRSALKPLDGDPSSSPFSTRASSEPAPGRSASSSAENCGCRQDASSTDGLLPGALAASLAHPRRSALAGVLAVMPAGVHNAPSRMKMRKSGSAAPLERRSANSARQCVVARRPSSNPAAASTRRPTDAVVPPGAGRGSADASLKVSAQAVRRGTLKPPTMISVSSVSAIKGSAVNWAAPDEATAGLDRTITRSR